MCALVTGVQTCALPIYLALRHGADADVDVVIADEFHFYADPQRGCAWQVPLLLLNRARFVLMSAPLGALTDISADLEDRKSVGSGNRLSVRVDLGGARIINKKIVIS